MVNVLLGIASGCHHTSLSPKHPTSQSIYIAISSGLTSPVNDDELKATVAPPLGWAAAPPKVSPNHRHQIWLSPTGDTAYGIIYFNLPLPVGVDMALWGFLREMKKTEGEATLMDKSGDDRLPGVRFIAEGGFYRIRCNLMVDGFHGWAVYAGTLRARPVNQAELKKAELAREQTRVNVP